MDGRHSRWDAHREARRNELIEAAIVAVRDYGHTVGMDQIAAVAHTSKPVIYRYFSDKADLYNAVGQQMAAHLQRMITKAVSRATDTRGRLRAAIDAYLGVLDETPELYQFVVLFPVRHRHTRRGHTAPGGELLGDFVEVIGRLITAQLAQDLERRGLDPKLASPWGESMMGFVRAAGDWWLANPTAMTRAELSDHLTALLWSGAEGMFAGDTAGRTDSTERTVS